MIPVYDIIYYNICICCAIYNLHRLVYKLHLEVVQIIDACYYHKIFMCFD